MNPELQFFPLSLSLSTMAFDPAIKQSASVESGSRYIYGDKKTFPNFDRMIMFVSDSGKYPHKQCRDKRESSLRHALFPSRNPPTFSSERDGKAWMLAKASKGQQLPRNNARVFAAQTFTNGKSNCVAATASVARTPRNLPSRQTLHRRNRHVFVSSHSPTKPSSPSPSKAKSGVKTMHTRKHHRHHNHVFHLIDFENIFGKV